MEFVCMSGLQCTQCCEHSHCFLCDICVVGFIGKQDFEVRPSSNVCVQSQIRLQQPTWSRNRAFTLRSSIRKTYIRVDVDNFAATRHDMPARTDRHVQKGQDGIKLFVKLSTA
eukprot:4058123-Amphidinium_carterae.1